MDEVNVPSVREQLHQIADGLSDDATWKDALYEIYFRQEVAAGRSEACRGQFAADDKVIATFAKWGVDLKINTGP